MRELLARWGCEVAACRDIHEAREALSRGHREVIIADYSLDGDESGLDWLQEVRDRSGNREFLGIMISAEQEPTLRARVRAAGHYFLAKPVDPASLRALLRRAGSYREREAVDSTGALRQSAV